MLKGEKRNRTEGGPNVVWDTAGMRTLYGSIFGIQTARDEICLLFGSRTVQDGRQETVMVSDRIVLSPFTAIRLLDLLRKIEKRHQMQSASEVHAFIETRN